MTLARWTRVAWWCVPALYAVMLALPGVDLPGDSVGLRRFLTPPLGPDLRLGQTFTMTANALHAIEVFPVAVTERVSGDVRFELYEIRGNEPRPLLRVEEVLAEDLVRGRSYRFEFAPIPISKDRVYRLDLVASPAEGVAFQATKGDRYPGGRMHANGRDRFADLAFQTYAPSPTIWGRLMTLRRTNPVRAYLVIAAFAAIWLILGAVARTLARLSPESGGLDPLRAA